MIDLDLTDEQRVLEQSVREWGAREMAPRIHELDRAHRFDPDILPRMASLGLLGICIPSEYGGAGMDYVSLGIASEELEYVDTSLRVIMSVHVGLSSLTLLAWGTEDQRTRYLAPQAQGKQIGSYALTEPGAGSDVRALQTVAVQKGDRYLLTGEKMWISLGDVAHNFLVFAWSDPEKKKQRDVSGITAFIVERGFKGFSSGTLKEKWGILAGNTGFFKMEEVEVPQENVVGRPDEGFKVAMFCARPRSVHGRGRCDGAHSGVPGRQRQVREGAQDVWCRDRAPPARQGDDRADGVRLPGVAAALATRRLAEEPGPAQHARDWPGEVVCDGGVRAGGRRRRPDSRRQWLLRRVPGWTLLSELQGGGNLRGHARDSQADAS